QFFLNQIYPNPFNPTTQIQFSLPVSTVVRLEVFSVLGQRTATLLNKQMPVGVHTVPFDARSLSSGVYIYRLTTPEFSQSRLMNFVK
ncbi:MAG: T9SS C-terminal target domain-containing protein, partial [Balneolaceae bacterium]